VRGLQRGGRMETGELLEALERGERDRRPVEVAGLRFTSLDKVMWPGAGVTKGDLVRYCVRVAGVMTRYIDDRPLMLKRYNDGVEGAPVVQQRAPAEVPDGVRTAEAPTAEGESVERYIGSRETLLYAAQLNAVEIHCWHSRLVSIDRPDWVVLDLDPSPGAGFRKVVSLARSLRDRIEELGLKVGVKTTGSRGLHLHIVTGGRLDYDSAAELARLLAEGAATAHPGIGTVERSVKERGYRVYIDHLQNARGKTAIAAYSTRARPGAPVAMPIRWEEVTEALDPRGYLLADVPGRLEREGDAWEGLFERPSGDPARAIDRLAA